MAQITAQASGNWSNTATWGGGVLPGVGDIAETNGNTVTIDQNINVVGLQVTSGPGFSISSARTLTLTGTLGMDRRGDNGPVLVFATGSYNVTINGNVTGGGAGSGRRAIDFTTSYTGTLTIVGNVTGGAAAFAVAMNLSSSSSGKVDITGNVTGGAGSDAYAVNITGSGQQLTMRGGTLQKGGTYGSGAYAIQHTTGAVRMDMLIDVGVWPFLGTANRQLIVGGTTHQMKGPGDSSWPAATGAYITVPTVGGAAVPTSGVIWPNGVNA